MTTNLTLTAAAFASGKFGQGLSAGKGVVGLVPAVPFTVEAWVATTAAVLQVAVGGSNSSVQFWVGVNASGFAQGSAGGANDVSGTIKVNDGLLHHIAMVYTASGSSLYVDGTAQGTTSNVSPSAAGLNVGVGAFAAPLGGNDYAFSGLIDEVRISTIARYTAPFTPPATAFVRDATTTALWHLDGNGLDDPGTAAGAATAGVSASVWRVVIHSAQNTGDRTSLAEVIFATSASGPSAAVGGSAQSLSADGPNVASNAFDSNIGTYWASAVNLPPDQYVQYTFPSAVKICELRLVSRNDSYYTQFPSSIELQASADGTTFTKVQSYTPSVLGGGQTVAMSVAVNAPADVAAPAAATSANRYWRVLVSTTATGDKVELDTIRLYAAGSSVNLATVVAQASASEAYDSGYVAGNAIDGVAGVWSTRNVPPQWWQYDLGVGQAASVTSVSITAGAAAPGRAPATFVIQSSSDGVAFSNVWSGSFPAWSSGQTQVTTIPVPGAVPAPSNVMVSQSRLEVLGKGLPKVTVAQSQLEVLGKTNPAALVSQSFVEVLFRPSSNTPGPRPRRVFVAMT